MSRPLRILVAGGWYHVMNRGNRLERIFVGDADRRWFLGLVAQLPDRFHLEVHGFVLMDNHYHLLLRTLEPNLSHAIRWLHVSYSSRFNWVNRKVGHVFQGRFRAQILQEEKRVAEVARYLHLNPVRTGGLGLGKAEQRQAKVLGCPDPGAELVSRRLKRLREYRWSSWRVYSGMEPRPDWLETSVVGSSCGGRNAAARRAAVREYTEAPVRQGHLPSPWEQLVGGVALGDTEWAQELLKGRTVSMAEQPSARELRRGRRIPWPRIVRESERIRGKTWKAMLETHGEWGRDAAMYVAVRFGGYRLAEVLQAIPGLRYAAAAQAVKRFAAAVESDPERTRFVGKLRRFLSTIET